MPVSMHTRMFFDALDDSLFVNNSFFKYFFFSDIVFIKFSFHIKQ